MALTEKSFHQVKSILNRLDRSIDDLRARRGTSQNPALPQGQPAGQNPAPSPNAGASQNQEHLPGQAGKVPNQTPGAPASVLNQTIGSPTAGASPKAAGPSGNGTGSFGHANGSGQTPPQRPGAQFGRATPILPKQG